MVSGAIKVSQVVCGKTVDVYLDVRKDAAGNGAYIEGSKNCRKLERILLDGNRYQGTDRPMCRTSILKRIKDLRDEAVRKAVNANDDADGRAVNGVCFRFGGRREAEMLLIEGTACTVQLEPMHGLAAHDIKVLRDKPGKALWFEATIENFAYVATFMRADIASGAHTPTPRHTRLEPIICGLTHASSSGHVRARKTVEGVVVNKYYKIANDEENAKSKAMEFLGVVVDASSDEEDHQATDD